MLISQQSPERRWGSKERVDDEDRARERLLNAAEVCFERYGLRRTTIDDVAREAKVSRSTVYRYFEGRGDLIAGAYLRESQEVNDKVKALMSKPGPFADRLVKAMLRSITSMQSGKYLPLMLTPEWALLASKAITASQAFFDQCAETMTPFIEQAKVSGELRADIAVEDFIEWTLRIIFSFAMIESPVKRDAKSLRLLLEDLFIPALTPR